MSLWSDVCATTKSDGPLLLILNVIIGYFKTRLQLCFLW